MVRPALANRKSLGNGDVLYQDERESSMKHTFLEKMTPISVHQTQKNIPSPRIASNQARSNRSDSLKNSNRTNHIRRKLGEGLKTGIQSSDYEAEADFEE